MNPDCYNKDGKPYQICNLYLDTEKDEFITESLEKPVYKEKLRIRSYGIVTPKDEVFLEIKKKYKGLVNKRRTGLYYSDVSNFFQNGTVQESPLINPQVISEISYVMKRRPVVPKVFISYERFAFFEKNDDDFRLTFDRNIISRRKNLSLSEEIYGDHLLKDGVYLMEAKAWKTFPIWFARLLSENKIFPVSFSKYGYEYTQYRKAVNHIV